MNDRFDDVHRISEERSHGSHEIFFLKKHDAQYNIIISLLFTHARIYRTCNRLGSHGFGVSVTRGLIT